MKPNLETNWRKFRLLMWKNFILQWRNKYRTLIEIFIPIIFSVCLVFIRNKVEPEHIPKTSYTSFDIESLSSLRHSKHEVRLPIKEWRLVFTPNNSKLFDLLSDVSRDLDLTEPIGVSSSSDLENVFINRSLLAGIEFNDIVQNVDILPNMLSYNLRFPSILRLKKNETLLPSIYTWKTNLLLPLFWNGARNSDENDGGLPWYNREGFLPIQHAIARNFIKMKGENQIPKIKMQRFPYPAHNGDILLDQLKAIAPMFIVLSFILPTISTVRYITIEKETHLTEVMKIMGLPNWLHLTGWFIKTIIHMLIINTLMVIVLKIPMFNESVPLFKYSDWSILWLFFSIYTISITTFCFLMSSIFSNANNAAMITGFVWLLLILPFTCTESSYAEMTIFWKIIVCLPLNTAISYGIAIIFRFEGTGEGLKWTNWMDPVSIDDDLSIGIIFIIMLISSIIHLVIALLIEKLSQKSNESAKPSKYIDLTNSNVDDKNFEKDPINSRAGITVKNLRKIYDNGNTAVKELTMKMYDNQITVLLGHNGAGKTTTMSMLTGIVKPTSGTATINGFDILTDLNNARNSIGICPQHNILFDDLTVNEHIQFFCQLKDLDVESIEKEKEKFINLLGLESKANVLSKTLSGGMKRKLSLVLALCGNSKVVLCDEPTSGMDTIARRELWNLLQAEKNGRTILLSTHFMDEADALGDRVAIMSNGELKCYGSPYYLKKRFGSGYNLICAKDNKCITDDVTTLLKKYIPNIQIYTDIGQELSYKLPRENVETFETMLKELEDKQSNLNVNGFGLSLPTIEDVFMKIYRQSSNDQSSDSDDIYHINYDLENGFTLMKNQFLAMFKKQYILCKRSWLLFIFEIIMIIIFINVGISVARSKDKDNSLSPLTIKFDSYSLSVNLIETAENLSRIPTLITNKYVQNLSNNIHIINDEMENYFIKLATANLVSTNRDYLIGATIKNNELISWFNGQAFHSAPLSLNELHNTIIRSIFNDNYGIKVTNRPIQYGEYSIKLVGIRKNSGFYVAIYIGLIMSVISSIVIIIYIKERNSKFKLIQSISGLGCATYWLSSFIWEYAKIILSETFIVITLWSLNEERWTQFDELFRFFLILMIFNVASISLTFVISKFFTAPLNGFIQMLIFNILTGSLAYEIVTILSPPVFGLKETVEFLQNILIFFPHYALVSSIDNLYQQTSIKLNCDSVCIIIDKSSKNNMDQILSPNCNVDYFSLEHNGVGRSLLYMISVGIISLAILTIMECNLSSRVIDRIMKRMKKIPLDIENDPIDSDVRKEKERIDSFTMNDIASRNLVLKNLSKYYGNFAAVNQLSISVESNECFGLLGTNGAGKTVTFKMLTGDTSISYGNGWIRGTSFKSNARKVFEMIGYCPQFDALLNELTCRETLEILALLQGIPRQEINKLIKMFAIKLNFTNHIDKKISECSGGNRRKLSTAITLLGNPYVIYLDEPTAGMDPVAKRHLWKVICSIRESGTSIILTTHSMEECEALCNRLTIMMNGEFKCLGSIQHLKNKFSCGFILIIKIEKISKTENSTDGTGNVFQIKNYVSDSFPGKILREEYHGLLTYYIPTSTGLKWSDMFRKMENCKKKYQIEDYSISQTSLDQLFSSFTK